MILGELFKNLSYTVVMGSLEQTVNNIAYDSRSAASGMVFVCLPGAVTDGHLYAAGAYKNGARMFVCEYFPKSLSEYSDITVVTVTDTRYALAQMSVRFFDSPAKRLKVIGITGTKGKTSISFMLKSIFETAGKKAGIIGSTGVYYGDTVFKLPNTTPESYELQKIFYDMAEAGMEYAVLEATSQGFFMHRTDGVVFDVALFTNFSPDHVSNIEHPDVEHYLKSKKKIFNQCDFCFINGDADDFEQITDGISCEWGTFGFTPKSDYYADDVTLSLNGKAMSVEFICHTPQWSHPARVNIPGAFSASNAMAAVCAADRLGIDRQAIIKGLAGAVVKGRMELVEVPAPYTVMIDFAHNALSVRSLMETAKQYNPQRIICIFGLEGNRAKIRRYDSGEIIGRFADLTILANASPRTENPADIISDIIVGLERSGGEYLVIPDRSEAIRYALDHARSGDLILLVGKGNVLYEEVNGQNIYFNEREVVADYFRERQSAISS
ncbi:MAG TPA: UDP-N-acetylmuramoyl-L-alanyl-D-glutamate--2,6-diaminopimelate ligase [Ruminococcaceae bacterium]|nr:UDP-N-acetylmuramoyl-L-alanyl-D-glutamate--2,6-diaminopimelate ligase [Oscillospiraceae bacterium]